MGADFSMTTLDWNHLLNPQRRKDHAAGKPPTRKVGEARTELERDHDRILFSAPTRRLQDKTQVFPLEKNDSVRTRLTHSHEVANMARSMGTTLAFGYVSELGLPPEVEATRNVPALLEAIGLAHDLGNPPFGHQGERAIQDWMATKHDGKGKSLLDEQGLSQAQKNDFLKFEGNAQSFRLLTRLQVVNDDFGLNMTYAFLAALMKYPIASDATRKGSQARKKFNFFQSEAEIAREVWAATGLSEGVRHPLTFVMEACDDIAYSVVDVEDAGKKGLIGFSELMTWLAHGEPDDAVVQAVVDQSKKRHDGFRGKDLSPRELDDISFQMFRVTAIGAMVNAAIDTFVGNAPLIMKGEFDQELLAASKAGALWRALKRFASSHVYNHKSVLEVELEGHRTIHALMDMFWDAISKRDDPADLTSRRSPLAGYVYSRISENYRRVAQADSNANPMRYRELQLITDMISGMTDSFAISLCADLRRHHG